MHFFFLRSFLAAEGPLLGSLQAQTVFILASLQAGRKRSSSRMGKES